MQLLYTNLNFWKLPIFGEENVKQNQYETVDYTTIW